MALKKRVVLDLDAKVKVIEVSEKYKLDKINACVLFSVFVTV
jgi:hypothetical protein